MISGRDKFIYSYGFLDCFIMMSGDTVKMRDKHAWVIEEMWKAFIGEASTEEVQSLVNEMNRSQIWKTITETMQGKMMSDTINKGLKDKMSSY